MMEKQLTPVGYKQTEVGVIPEDWAVKSLGELVSSVEYGSSAKSSKTGLMPVLRMGNLQSGKIDWNDLVFTSDPAEIAKYKLNKNDVLFNRTNTVDLVGKTSIYKGEYPAVFAGYLIRINRIENLLDADYLNYVLNSHHSKIYSKLILSVAVSQANINGQKLKTYPIPTPPNKQEQTAIANALSDVDALIAALEKLINKKSAIKTAAMQQLLTGKKRLPPFDQLNTGYKQTELGEIPGDWEVGELGDYLDTCSSGATPYRGRPEFYKGSIRWISSGELNYNVIYDTIEKISEDAVKKTNLKIHPKGTFLIAITGLEAAGTRGSCGFVGAPSATNQSCMALYTNNRISTNYLFHYYVYKGDELAFKYCQGTKQQSYTAKIVKLLPIVLPKSLEEQTAIANVLSDMDKELEALQQRLHKTQQIKQGMMQELLTGKTRLVKPAVT